VGYNLFAMNNFNEYFERVFSWLSELSLKSLTIILACAFFAVFIIVLLFCVFSPKVRRADKKPFFHLVNIFTALSLSLFLSELNLSYSISFACLFWVGGYLLYGVLCVVTKKGKRESEDKNITISSYAVSPKRESVFPEIPAAKNSVRLEHALSIADKLLIKNLGKGDRQELEKMKSTLTVLQIKGTLTPQEGEILNDIFNALLKLMAKYNL
jgi:Ca2+/Na+ antiporter